MSDLTEERINEIVFSSRFLGAYEMLLTALEENPGDANAISLSKILTKELRRRAMDLGMSKATECSIEAYEMEALLKLAIRLNGETMYG